MEASDIRNLQEAYLEMYEVLDEKFKRFNFDVVGDKLDSIRNRAALLQRVGRHSSADAQIKRGEHIANIALRMGGYVDDKGNKVSEPDSGWTIKNREAELKIAKQKQKVEKANIIRGKRKRKLERAFNMPSVTEELKIILNYLIDEGYATSIEGAEVILENMSEGWMESIMEAFVDPETGEAPSGRSPVENVSYHPKKSVRRKAMGAFAHQMGKEYGGKWKAKTKDPTKDD